MITPEMIPKEVIVELLAALNSCDCDDCTSVAIAAAINAWPGAKMGSEDFYEDVAGMLCIPLTENNNAEV